MFYNTPGILTSLNLTVNDNYPWEIAMNEPELGESKDMQEVPQIIDVAVEFKPIMSVAPIREKYSSNGPIVNSKILLQGSKWIGRSQENSIATLEQQINTSETGIDSPVTPPNLNPNINDLFEVPGQINTGLA